MSIDRFYYLLSSRISPNPAFVNLIFIKKRNHHSFYEFDLNL